MYASLPAGSVFYGVTETERLYVLIYAFLLVLPFLILPFVSTKVKLWLNQNQLYIVWVDWRDRQYPPEILGVYKTEEQASLVMNNKYQEFETDGYTEEDVIIRIETVENT